MSENRRQILDMLAGGQITADEADRLIAALDGERPTAGGANGSDSRPKAKAKYLRVIVEADDTREGRGPTNVNVRVPMQLLRAGVKLAGLIPAQARQHVDSAMREHGVPFDLSQIKPENLEELIDHLEDLTVDVDQKNDKVKVRVFCE
jgi:hypothetical protein